MNPFEPETKSNPTPHSETTTALEANTDTDIDTDIDVGIDADLDSSTVLDIESLLQADTDSTDIPTLADIVGDATNPSEDPRRKAVVPPRKTKAGMNLFDYLRNCNPPLDKKIIDIACAEAKVPPALRRDAAQDICVMWTVFKPDLAFKPGQIASYAHRMAHQTALRTRRDMGGPVRLPASAFRKRKDGSSYLNPGLLAEALDWNFLEAWMQIEGTSEASFSGVSPMTSAHDAILNHIERESTSELSGSSETVHAFNERMTQLDRYVHVLTRRQYTVMRALIEGSSFEEIEKDLDIRKGLLMKELAIATGLMASAD